MRLLQVEMEGALVKLAVVFHQGAEAPLSPAVEAATCWVPLVEVLRGCGLTEAGWEEDRGDAGIARAAAEDRGCLQHTGRRRSREAIGCGGAGGDDARRAGASSPPDARGQEMIVRGARRHETSGHEAVLIDGAEEQCNSSSSSGGRSLDQPALGQGTPKEGQVAVSPLTCRPEYARLRPLIPHVLAAILAR